MEHLMIPENYESALSLHDTQVAIKTVKDFFRAYDKVTPAPEVPPESKE